MKAMAQIGRFRPFLDSTILVPTSQCRANKGLHASCIRNYSSKSQNIAAEAPLSSFLVTPQSLASAIRDNANRKISTEPRVIPLCAAWFMPNDAQGRTGKRSYLDARIPRARFFDIDAVTDQDSPYPHMLPSGKRFADAMGRLGIRKNDRIVVYDSAELGIFSAPRVAWTLKLFGHQPVHILNNFKLWVDQGFPVEDGQLDKPIEPCDYPTPVLAHTRVMLYDQLKDHIQAHNKEAGQQMTILDARSRERFQGTAKEPRPGIPSGHMPSAMNIPYTDVLNARTKTFLSPEELRVYFECKNVDPTKPIVSTCGTGMTACILDVALTEAGYAESGRTVYDGSWTEWAMRADRDSLIVKQEPEHN